MRMKKTIELPTKIGEVILPDCLRLLVFLYISHRIQIKVEYPHVIYIPRRCELNRQKSGWQ